MLGSLPLNYHAPAHLCVPGQVWQDALTKRAPAPYLTHSLSHGLMTQFRFCPYEVRA